MSEQVTACKYCKLESSERHIKNCKPMGRENGREAYLRHVRPLECGDGWWEIVTVCHMSRKVDPTVTFTVSHCPMCGRDLSESQEEAR